MNPRLVLAFVGVAIASVLIAKGVSAFLDHSLASAFAEIRVSS